MNHSGDPSSELIQRLNQLEQENRQLKSQINKTVSHGHGLKPKSPQVTKYNSIIYLDRTFDYFQWLATHKGLSEKAIINKVIYWVRQKTQGELEAFEQLFLRDSNQDRWPIKLINKRKFQIMEPDGTKIIDPNGRTLFKRWVNIYQNLLLRCSNVIISYTLSGVARPMDQSEASVNVYDQLFDVYDFQIFQNRCIDIKKDRDKFINLLIKELECFHT